MKVFCVRIGDKYGQEYEDYIERKLGSHYEVIWIREPIQDNVKLQWNKMYPMSLDLDEPVCVIDIDLLLINDYRKAFDYPVEKGQFLAMRAWWRDTLNPDYSINGGFLKYYPKDCNYIFDKFMSDPEHWQTYYIDTGITMGPVNGEQYFVEDSVREELELIHLPSSWAVRWLSDDDLPDNVYLEWQNHFTKKYKIETGNDYVYLGDFYDDIKLVHFTHAENLPHTWKHYQKHLYP
jgi:hypothetical protein